MFLLRLVDFFVRMWRLNAFWKVIAPVPVILKRFLALEFVLTFGILHAVLNVTLLAVLHRQDTYGAVWAIVRFVFTLLQGFLMGCKDRSLKAINIGQTWFFPGLIVVPPGIRRAGQVLPLYFYRSDLCC
jgi:hypothetical protein